MSEILSALDALVLCTERLPAESAAPETVLEAAEQMLDARQVPFARLERLMAADPEVTDAMRAQAAHLTELHSIWEARMKAAKHLISGRLTAHRRMRSAERRDSDAPVSSIQV